MSSVANTGPLNVASLRKTVSWTFAGSAAMAFSQWGILVAIAKFGSAELAGDWTLILAVTAPIFVFSFMKLRQFQATDARGEHEWRDLLAVRMVAMLAAFMLASIIGAIAFDGAITLAIIALALSRAFDGISDLAYGYLYRHEKMKVAALLMLGRATTALSVGIVAAWLTRSVIWIAVAIAATYAAWLAPDLRAVRTSEDRPVAPRWDSRAVRRIFRTVLPLGFVTAIGSLQINIPRYFLEANTDRTELGVFGSLHQLVFLGSVVIAAIGSASAPRLSRYAATGQWSTFSALLGRLVAAGALLGFLAIAGSVAAGPYVLRIVYSPQFAEHSDLLVWLAASSALLWSYVFLGTALDAMRRFSIQPWIHGLSTVVLVVSSALLVPAYRSKGAAWALMTAYSIECSLYALAVAVPLYNSRRTGAP